MSKRKEIIHGISATRASAILGLNKWKTPFLAWQEIQEKRRKGFNAEKGFILPPREDKAVFRWGHAFESAVIQLSEQAAGNDIVSREALARDHGTPESFCYVDGIYKNSNTVYEGKTTFERAFYKSWGEPGTDRVPDHVAVQVQHNMMCANADECITSVLVFPKPVDDFEEMGWRVREMEGGIYSLERVNDKEIVMSHSSTRDWSRYLSEMGYFHQYPVQAKPDTHKMLKEMYADFWHRYVLTETPPEITDYEDIRRCFPSPKGTLVVGKKIADKLRQYARTTAEIGTGGYLATENKKLKTEILKICLEKTTVADEEAVEKIMFVDESGNSLGSFNGKTFRARKQ